MLTFLTEKSRTSCSFLQQALAAQLDNVALKSGPGMDETARKSISSN